MRIWGAHHLQLEPLKPFSWFAQYTEPIHRMGWGCTRSTKLLRLTLTSSGLHGGVVSRSPPEPAQDIDTHRHPPPNGLQKHTLPKPLRRSPGP